MICVGERLAFHFVTPRAAMFDLQGDQIGIVRVFRSRRKHSWRSH
jgi:hypothetical protein